MPPTCFIFCGNFSSAPYGKSQIKSLKGEKLLGMETLFSCSICYIYIFFYNIGFFVSETLKALADLICEHPSIHNR